MENFAIENCEMRLYVLPNSMCLDSDGILFRKWYEQ